MYIYIVHKFFPLENINTLYVFQTSALNQWYSMQEKGKRKIKKIMQETQHPWKSNN